MSRDFQFLVYRIVYTERFKISIFDKFDISIHSDTKGYENANNHESY